MSLLRYHLHDLEEARSTPSATHATDQHSNLEVNRRRRYSTIHDVANAVKYGSKPISVVTHSNAHLAWLPDAVHFNCREQQPFQPIVGCLIRRRLGHALGVED